MSDEDKKKRKRRRRVPQEVAPGPLDDMPISDPKLQVELEQIAAQHGGLLPAGAVVQWAREHPRSKLHGRFEWDDSAAAEQFRLWQARSLIAKVTIEPRPDVHVRAWVSLPSDRVGGDAAYRPTVRVMSDAGLRAELIKTVVDELARVRRKHADLVELASIWQAIDGASAP